MSPVTPSRPDPAADRARGARHRPRRPRPATLLALLTGVTVLAAGCSSSTGADEVVTVRTTVAGPASPGSPSGSTTRSSRPPTSRSTAPTGAAGGTPSSSTPSATTPSATTPSETTAGPPTTRSTTGRSSAGVPTANAPDADPNTPGPETGPRCATDSQYVDEQPTGLRSDVVTGWRAVEKAANADGVIVCLNDGKRSRAQQLAQYQQYVDQYGKEVADQLVLPPEKSAHVVGIAIDVQPQAAYRWLQATKGSLGFCRIYDNEPWHFEYDVSYFTRGCPARLPKPQR